MLTVDFNKFNLNSSNIVLDLGCGLGRHAYQVYKSGSTVVATDLNFAELKSVAGMFYELAKSGETKPSSKASVACLNAEQLPFKSGSFDRVIISEVLEHVNSYQDVLNESFRVLKSPGLLAITVPRFYPELINWALSNEYHEVEGGHVRIFRKSELFKALNNAGFNVITYHYAHGLHSPYWWLRCLVGLNNENKLVNFYQKVLETEIISNPPLLRVLNKLTTPIMGKSIVVYGEK